MTLVGSVCVLVETLESITLHDDVVFEQKQNSMIACYDCPEVIEARNHDEQRRGKRHGRTWDVALLFQP